MPKVTIWVRNDDWQDWMMIEDVPEFIHAAIARQNLEDGIAVREHVVDEGKRLGKLPEHPIKTFEDPVVSAARRRSEV